MQLRRRRASSRTEKAVYSDFFDESMSLGFKNFPHCSTLNALTQCPAMYSPRRQLPTCIVGSLLLLSKEMTLLHRSPAHLRYNWPWLDDSIDTLPPYFTLTSIIRRFPIPIVSSLAENQVSRKYYSGWCQQPSSGGSLRRSLINERPFISVSTRHSMVNEHNVTRNLTSR